MAEAPRPPTSVDETLAAIAEMKKWLPLLPRHGLIALGGAGVAEFTWRMLPVAPGRAVTVLWLCIAAGVATAAVQLVVLGHAWWRATRPAGRALARWARESWGGPR